MSRKHKLVKKTNKSCLASVRYVIEPLKKMTTLALRTFKWPKWWTWSELSMPQIDNFFHCMCWKFKNLAFGPNNFGIGYNPIYPRYGTSTLDSIKDKVRIGPTRQVWVLIACLDPKIL
jgi:hypothetical protein